MFDETITQARVGWADGGLVHHLLQKGFTAEDIQSTRLVNKYGEDHFKNEIIFPYLEHGVAISLSVSYTHLDVYKRQHQASLLRYSYSLL